MPHEISLMKQRAPLVLLVFGVLLSAAWAQTESVLYSFCAQGSPCTDGSTPVAPLILDQKGNLYGTTEYGGAYSVIGGVVFKLTPAGKYTVLYSFCAQAKCTDGETPVGGLVLDQKGNLYGTTYNGGNSNCDLGGCGVVFKLTPRGKETVLYSFCAQSGCTDGWYAEGGLISDQEGNLYGTTQYGGAYNNWGGTVFKVTPRGKETVLYSFCAQSGCVDGTQPDGGVVFDQKGNLYGTTYDGGSHNSGVVFKLTPDGKETVLYSFCAQTNCTDGAGPLGGIVFDQKGNLYGTTQQGGSYDRGTVFKVTPNGKETVLHSFCRANYPCTDGAEPLAGPVFDQEGNLYGTTSEGGAPGNAGVVFRLTPEGEETVLYSFCWEEVCADGKEPVAGLVFDQKGNLFGTTSSGGAYGIWRGTVFKLTW